jgi:hypothetical protein
MTPLALIALLFVAPPRTVFPGGSIRAAEGCTAPPRIKMLIDAFLGTVECPKQRLSIAVFGGAMIGPACSSEEKRLTLHSSTGRPLVMCATERRGAGDGRLIRELVVDLGPGQLSAVVRSPQDVLLVLQLAASYEPD